MKKAIIFILLLALIQPLSLLGQRVKLGVGVSSNVNWLSQFSNVLPASDRQTRVNLNMFLASEFRINDQFGVQAEIHGRTVGYKYDEYWTKSSHYIGWDTFYYNNTSYSKKVDHWVKMVEIPIIGRGRIWHKTNSSLDLLMGPSIGIGLKGGESVKVTENKRTTEDVDYEMVFLKNGFSEEELDIRKQKPVKKVMVYIRLGMQFNAQLTGGAVFFYGMQCSMGLKDMLPEPAFNMPAFNHKTVKYSFLSLNGGIMVPIVVKHGDSGG